MAVVESGTKRREAIALLKYWVMALELLDRDADPLAAIEALASLVAGEVSKPIELIRCEPRTFHAGTANEFTVDVQPLVDYHAAVDAYYAKKVRESLEVDEYMRAALVARGWTPPEET